jgi:hypothetical protein
MAGMSSCRSFLYKSSRPSRIFWFCPNIVKVIAVSKGYEMDRQAACRKHISIVDTVHIQRNREFMHIVARIRGDYIRRVLDWQLDLLGHTQLHTITVYTLLQLHTVHYNTCRVFTLYLHWLPVFQFRRIRSPATLQLFSEDCCSARILTRNWKCPRHCYLPTNSATTVAASAWSLYSFAGTYSLAATAGYSRFSTSQLNCSLWTNSLNQLQLTHWRL